MKLNALISWCRTFAYKPTEGCDTDLIEYEQCKDSCKHRKKSKEPWKDQHHRGARERWLLLSLHPSLDARLYIERQVCINNNEIYKYICHDLCNAVGWMYVCNTWKDIATRSRSTLSKWVSRRIETALMWLLERLTVQNWHRRGIKNKMQAADLIARKFTKTRSYSPSVEL